jgi:hypothetical protein
LRIEFVDPVSVSALWWNTPPGRNKLDKPVQWLTDERNAGASAAARPGAVHRSPPRCNWSTARQRSELKHFCRAYGLRRVFPLVELPDTAPVLAVADKLDALRGGRLR